ncbi:MAG: hypothetical protein KTR15_01165 [Phycisphaeraceae bacterium]|nr:hypothetical protein [Phycisphaeraceae bacterium]
MKIRLLICAFAVAMLTNSASATYGSWGDWGKFWDNWKQFDWDKHWDHKKDKKKDHKKDKWCKDNRQWEKDCNWGQDCKKKKKKRKGKKKGKRGDKCDPPSAVPTPTAAIAGLGVMGLMLTRRRNKQG